MKDRQNLSVFINHTLANNIAQGYDLDGNLLDDGVYLYTWNDENRLIKLTDKATGNTLAEYQYDYQGRRISKKVAGQVKQYVYDGWNMIAEFDGLNAVQATHTWGTDLSGTMQGAGGVGGLLSTTNYTNDQASEASSFYPAYDANGNITEYVDEAGVVQAHYQYDEFGKTLASSGTKSDDFGFRFSTKLLDDESSHYYYGYRYYTPQTGKWLSRDPIAEEGGFNLYGFVGNNSIDSFDYNGLLEVTYNPQNAASAPVNYLNVLESNRQNIFSSSTSHNGTMSCSCACDSNIGKYKITCDVSFTSRITISQAEANNLNTTSNGILGHEQRHILSRGIRVENKVVTPLEAEISEFELETECDLKAFEYEIKYEPILNNNLDAAVIPDHIGDPDSNQFTPATGVAYPPLPGSINLP